MAHIDRKEGFRTTLNVGDIVPVHSFGHYYKAEVVELKPRTALIRYTNKSGTEWVLRVKRDDIAAPTAAQKAATERGVQTRTLKSQLRWRKNELDYATQQMALTLEEINASRAESKARAIGYGWKTYEHDEPMTPEQFAIHQARCREYLEKSQAKYAQAQVALADHLYNGGK